MIILSLLGFISYLISFILILTYSFSYILLAFIIPWAVVIIIREIKKIPQNNKINILWLFVTFLVVLSIIVSQNTFLLGLLDSTSGYFPFEAYMSIMTIVLEVIFFFCSIILVIFIVPWAAIMLLRKINGTPQNEKINKLWKILFLIFIFSIIVFFIIGLSVVPMSPFL